MSRRPELADYAAIGVGPVLIFLMISSLATYFVMLLSGGRYDGNLSYLIMMFTMGAVACARIVIEFDRNYAAVYTFGLGAAMFLVTFRFLGSPLFSLGLIVLIFYLADRIVHDCTLIDEKVDASGEGLIDRGLDELQTMRYGAKEDADDRPQSERQQRRKRSHQPGRTVFLLALAALPLFGFGQFMLKDHPRTWQNAQLLLGLYLFSSLSLLVTTSFLNLRRYLRQRDVDMPGDVTIAWLAGGIGLIAALLLLSYLIPLPGSMLASVSVPEFLSPEPTTASRYGWGDEAADKSASKDDAETGAEQSEQGKQQKGQGDNQNEPTESGGSRASDNENANKGDNQNSKQTTSGESKSKDSQSQSASQSDKSSSDDSKNKSEDAKSSQSKNKSNDDAEQSSSQQSDMEQSNQPKPSSEGQEDEQQGDQSEPASKQESREDESIPPDSLDQSDIKRESQQDRPEENRQSESSTAESSAASSISSMLRNLGSILKFLIIIGLVFVVAFYLYRIREQLLKWLQGLFGDREANLPSAETPQATAKSDPPRPFSSFQNPIGAGADPRRIIVVTFQAFEAWAREGGFVRRQDETPAEFITRLNLLSRQQQQAQQLFASTGPAADRLGKAYDRIVYGKGSASRQDVEAAERLWDRMSRREVVVG